MRLHIFTDILLFSPVLKLKYIENNPKITLLKRVKELGKVENGFSEKNSCVYVMQL